MVELLDKTFLDENMATLPLWQQAAYQAFSKTIGDKANTYPCVPGRRGFLSNNIRFSFIGDPREACSIQDLSEVLKAYGSCSRETGKYASLVVLFETDEKLKETYTIEDYRKLFWSVLSRVSTYDKKEWPKEIPTDPWHHQWEFCFDGDPYFSFCATPAHQIRKSRHFPCFLIAFQPRFVFDELNNTTILGQKMKNLIRQRLNSYDGIPAHPDLKWYGEEDNHEWKQYFLSDNESSPSSCPFSQIKKQAHHLPDHHVPETDTDLNTAQVTFRKIQSRLP